MNITEELLMEKGLKLSTLKECADTYVNKDYSIRLRKTKIDDGWSLSLLNNYNEAQPKELFEDSRIRLVSGLVFDMEDIDKALAFCQKTWEDLVEQ